MQRMVSLIGLIIFCVSVPFSPAAQTLIIGTSEWRPWQIYADGQLTGITADIIRETEIRSGIEMPIRVLPHNRVLLEFKTGKIDCEPTVNSEWREFQKDISCYSVPFYQSRDILFVLKGRGIRGNTVEDFKGLSVGCGLGYYYPEGFQAAFEKGLVLREDNRVIDNNVIKLILGRIDGAILEKVQTDYLLKVFKIDRDHFETAYEFRPANLCFRLHKDKRELLPALNQAFESMRADGTIARIVMKYTK